jgi:hypothetical protein
MQKEQSVDRPNFIKRSMGVMKNNPDVSTAAHNGAPTMTPASESGDETIGFSLQPNAGSGAASTIGNSATVETVTPGSPNSIAPKDSATPATDSAPASNDSAPAADGSTQPAASGDATPATTQPADSSKESSSKKKSKLRKVIPF